jgi:hypothetical protein
MVKWYHGEVVPWGRGAGRFHTGEAGRFHRFHSRIIASKDLWVPDHQGLKATDPSSSAHNNLPHS